MACRDQRVYVQDLAPGSPPVALTAADSQQRFANYVLDKPRNRLLAVCEDHSKGDDQEATNSIAAIGKQTFVCSMPSPTRIMQLHLCLVKHLTSLCEVK
jgi:hypothetical protein